MERRLFTVAEANDALPKLSRVLKSLQERFRWLHGNKQTVSFLVAEYNIVNESPVDTRYFNTLMVVRGALREVEKIGAQVKDIGTGLVDFPARLHGKEVLLCWRLGEDRVRFWHDPDSGFSGRQPLDPADAEPDQAGGKGH